MQNRIYEDFKNINFNGFHIEQMVQKYFDNKKYSLKRVLIKTIIERLYLYSKQTYGNNWNIYYNLQKNNFLFTLSQHNENIKEIYENIEQSFMVENKENNFNDTIIDPNNFILNMESIFYAVGNESLIINNIENFFIQLTRAFDKNTENYNIIKNIYMNRLQDSYGSIFDNINRKKYVEIIEKKIKDIERNSIYTDKPLSNKYELELNLLKYKMENSSSTPQQKFVDYFLIMKKYNKINNDIYDYIYNWFDNTVNFNIPRTSGTIISNSILCSNEPPYYKFNQNYDEIYNSKRCKNCIISDFKLIYDNQKKDYVPQISFTVFELKKNNFNNLFNVTHTIGYYTKSYTISENSFINNQNKNIFRNKKAFHKELFSRELEEDLLIKNNDSIKFNNNKINELYKSILEHIESININDVINKKNEIDDKKFIAKISQFIAINQEQMKLIKTTNNVKLHRKMIFSFHPDKADSLKNEIAKTNNLNEKKKIILDKVVNILREADNYNTNNKSNYQQH